MKGVRNEKEKRLYNIYNFMILIYYPTFGDLAIDYLKISIILIYISEKIHEKSR